jgi:hypothetical protein
MTMTLQAPILRDSIVWTVAVLEEPAAAASAVAHRGRVNDLSSLQERPARIRRCARCSSGKQCHGC